MLFRSGRWGLTPRSSGAPTAGHAGHQALGLRPILRLLSSASCRRRPLSSNVRHHTSSRANRRFCSLRPRFKVQAIREQCGSLQRVNRALAFTALLPLWCVTQRNVSRSYPGSSASRVLAGAAPCARLFTARCFVSLLGGANAAARFGCIRWSRLCASAKGFG